jgi:N-acetyl-beta-hexosaminidase
MRQISLLPIVAKTATNTSDPISLEGVLKMTLQFTRSGHTSGSSVFSVEVTNDNINWVTYNKLIDNVANTNAQMLTRVASSTLSSNTSKVYTLNFQEDCFKSMRISATRVTDGTNDVCAAVQLEQ